MGFPPFPWRSVALENDFRISSVGPLMTKLILIDDHTILRSGARSLIERHMAEVEIVEAASLAETLSLLEAGFDADIAVLDMVLPDADGEKSLSVLRQRFSSMPVIILSGSEGAEDAMLLAGASAFVPKKGESLEIVLAIRAVLSGEPYVPGTYETDLALSGMSERQRALMKLCGEGLTNKEIGRALGISDNTVRAHLAILFRRFGVKNRVDLARFVGNGS